MTATDETFERAVSGMLEAFTEHVNPRPMDSAAAQDPTPDLSDFSDIFAQLRRLKHLTSMPSDEWDIARAGLEHMREQLGIPPLVLDQGQRVLPALDPEWRQVTPPAAGLEAALRSPGVAGSPQGQRIGEVYDALADLGKGLRSAAGQHYPRFLADGRTQAFLATVGARVTQTIARATGSLHTAAQALHERMNGIATSYQTLQSLKTLQSLQQVREDVDRTAERLSSASRPAARPSSAKPAPPQQAESPDSPRRPPGRLVAAAPAPARSGAPSASVSPGRPPGRRAAAAAFSPSAPASRPAPTPSPRNPAKPTIPVQGRKWERRR
ncbi:hypothetical protein ACQPYK_49055 (plasmid) [Streptosporangium sp. CA-135522]|uniref:hypothetical protein n=1 Tax=Streptosporangium sp. CA-135522 TaxID=3240072 RepID=UPI003D8FD1BE